MSLPPNARYTDNVRPLGGGSSRARWHFGAEKALRIVLPQIMPPTYSTQHREQQDEDVRSGDQERR